MPNLSKNERLNSRTQILDLLHEGTSTKTGAIKIIWSLRKPYENETHHIEAAFSVPKKLFKQAVKRNRLKRKMREIFRLNKETLTPYLNEKNCILSMLIIYLTNKDLPYQRMKEQMAKAFDAMLNDIRYENIQKF